jgi:NAD(P)-dependent dehydrogenase (short-subunit alcohol dehydrogenase family)
MEQPVAFVTGASRGIGAACAVALANEGHDIALGARTLREGEGRSASGYARSEAPHPIPGSLETTAQGVEQAGRRALAVPMDLLDQATLGNAVHSALERFGRTDVLVNCAIYKGHGDQDPFLDTPLELLERPIQANIVSQMALIKLVLPQMLERGSGTIVNLTSATARMDPPGPLGKGGWGFAYGVSKGGFDRVAGLLNVELGERGISAYNVDPGFVVYGPNADKARDAYPNVKITPPEAIGASIAWLATSPEARPLLGKTVHAPELCRSRGLLPGWE